MKTMHPWLKTLVLQSLVRLASHPDTARDSPYLDLDARGCSQKGAAAFGKQLGTRLLEQKIETVDLVKEHPYHGRVS